MTETSLAVIILAAGQGTRMRSAMPKVMHRVAGVPMLGHVMAAVEALHPARIVVVAGPEMPQVTAAAGKYPVAVQRDRLGTAHAVGAAREALGGESLGGGSFGAVLIAYGDTPLIRTETLSRMIDQLRAPGVAAVVLGMRPAEPGAYGRLVLGPDGDLERIVEAADASADELAIPLCNSGVIALAGSAIWGLIDRVGNANAKGEYYLTDVVGIARGDGLAVNVVEAEESELVGVNSRADLAAAEAILQNRLRARAMAGGTTLTDPPSVFLAADTKLGRDVVIGPNVVFGPGVTIADHVEIKAFCHIEGANVEKGAIIGPFARLRPGAAIGTDAHVGNFVEIKNSILGPGAKASHLTYLGDCDVGAAANIGAGTITCNYDGFDKYRTVIGAEVFIGTNSSLVAPVTIGDRAMTAAGSVITANVPPDALGIGRGRQANIDGFSASFRETKRAAKRAKQAKLT